MVNFEPLDRLEGSDFRHIVQRYSTLILTGCVAVLCGVLGYKYWQNQKVAEQMAQSQLFYGVTAASEKSLANPQDKTAQTQYLMQSSQLTKQYPDSAYAVAALLLQAKQASGRGDYAAAVAALQQAAASKSDDAGLLGIVNVRLATAQFEQNQPDAALATLKKVTLAEFEPTVDELQGDILIQKNDLKNAAAAYQRAWATLQKRQEPRPLLSVKMESLGLKMPEILPKSPVKIEAKLPNPAATEATS